MVQKVRLLILHTFKNCFKAINPFLKFGTDKTAYKGKFCTKF